MYVSRLTFHTLPGKTHEVEERLLTLLNWVENAGGMPELCAHTSVLWALRIWSLSRK